MTIKDLVKSRVKEFFKEEIAKAEVPLKTEEPQQEDKTLAEEVEALKKRMAVLETELNRIQWSLQSKEACGRYNGRGDY